MILNKSITLSTTGQALYEITHTIQATIHQSIEEWTSRVKSTKNMEGLCNLFVQHTSCSLIIQENADPSAKKDLENWLNRLVPENDPLYTHTAEGADDIPAHIKSILTQTQLTIPIINGELSLGIWQGIYLWEHRHHPHQRQVIVTLVY